MSNGCNFLYSSFFPSQRSRHMADYVGQQLGSYRIIRLLGTGGFAEVYLGEHMRLNTQAAIKVLHTQLTEKEMGEFLNEARTIARLDHPNIVRVYEFDVREGVPFLVMTYAPNGTLRHRHFMAHLSRPVPSTCMPIHRHFTQRTLPSQQNLSK